MINSYECDSCGKFVDVDSCIIYEDAPVMVNNKLVICRKCADERED